MNEALNRFRRVCAAPEETAAAWRATGGKVVGYVGHDVPAPMIHAAGLLPIRLSGNPARPSDEADRYLGIGLDPAARALLAALLRGDHAWCDHLVLTQDCHAHLQLFYALREIQRVEPRAHLPEPYFLDLLHLPHRTSARYNTHRLADFARTLGAWGGRDVDTAAMNRSIGLYRADAEATRRVLAARREIPAELTGSAALAVVGARERMPIEEHHVLVRELLASVGLATGAGPRTEPARTGTRVFLTGSSHDHPALYDELEAAGIVIVGEDHDWGELLVEEDIPTGRHPLTALVEHHQYGPTGSPRARIADRARRTRDGALRGRADIVVSAVRAGDDAPLWDFAAQREALRPHAIPAVLVRNLPYGPGAGARVLATIKQHTPVRKAG